MTDTWILGTSMVISFYQVHFKGQACAQNLRCFPLVTQGGLLWETSSEFISVVHLVAKSLGMGVQQP